MTYIPTWEAFALLFLASHRIWRLVAQDFVLDRPRRWVLNLGDWEEGDPISEVPANYRHRLAEFLACPWCLGFWICVGLWLVWTVWPEVSWLCVPFAMSDLVGYWQEKL